MFDCYNVQQCTMLTALRPVHFMCTCSGTISPHKTESAGLRFRFRQRTIVSHVIAMWSVHSMGMCFGTNSPHLEESVGFRGRLLKTRNCAPCDCYVVSSHHIYALR